MKQISWSCMPMFYCPIGMSWNKDMLCLHGCAERPPFQTSHGQRCFCFTLFQSKQQTACICVVYPNNAIAISRCKIFFIRGETCREHLCFSVTYCHLVSNFATETFVHWFRLYFLNFWIRSNIFRLWWILLLCLLHLRYCSLLANDCIFIKPQFL